LARVGLAMVKRSKSLVQEVDDVAVAELPFTKTKKAMTKILLSCNSDTYDIAADLSDNIEKQLGFKVALDVEHDDPVQSDADEVQEELLTEAAVLLVFQFGDERISAWVMIEDSDKRCGGITYKESQFPETINFSKSVDRGIRIFRYIMVNEFGLIV